MVGKPAQAKLETSTAYRFSFVLFYQRQKSGKVVQKILLSLGKEFFFLSRRSEHVSIVTHRRAQTLGVLQLHIGVNEKIREETRCVIMGQLGKSIGTGGPQTEKTFAAEKRVALRVIGDHPHSHARTTAPVLKMSACLAFHAQDHQAAADVAPRTDVGVEQSAVFLPIANDKLVVAIIGKTAEQLDAAVCIGAWIPVQ